VGFLSVLLSRRLVFTCFFCMRGYATIDAVTPVLFGVLLC
jgi:hypothetical protein